MAKWKQHIGKYIFQEEIMEDRFYRCLRCGDAFHIIDYKELYEELKNEWGHEPCTHCFGDICPLCWRNGKWCPHCHDQGDFAKECVNFLKELK